MCCVRRFILALLVALATAPLSTVFAQSNASGPAASSAASDAAGASGSPAVIADAATQKELISDLITGSFYFAGISLGLILAIALLVRMVFWETAAKTGPAKWRNHLMQLPLGAPEGSVRALLSLFVVVFGLLVIALRGYLGLGNVEAIAGFVGSVITFYFTARASEQARTAALQAQESVGAQVAAAAGAAQAANTAAVNNAQANVDAAHGLLKDTVSAVTDIATSAVQASTQAAQPGAPAADPAAADSANLAAVKDKLTDLQQVARGVNSLGSGANVLPNIAQTLSASQSLLDQITPLLTGGANAATVAKVLQDATAKLPGLEASGLPGVLAEAAQVLGDVATPIVAGLPGGPVGIVGGVLVAAIHLANDGPKLKAFQAAILGPPFDPVLLPDTADPTVAPAVLAQSPLMSAHFANASPDVAKQLMALAVGRNPDGTHRNGADLANLCATDISNQASVELPPRSKEFVSQDELMQAFDEYLGVLVRMGASNQLSGSVTMPPSGDAKAPVAVDLRALADAASQFVTIPAGAAELERIVSLGEALGKLPISPDNAIALVNRALDAVAAGGLVQAQETEQ